jgi:FkbH-like protein
LHQLFQRTNQFNTTTRRYDAGELAKLSNDPAARLYTLRARDRFGDHGLVAVALVQIEDENGPWHIDSFLMSCRVIGYGIETALLAVVSEAALAAGSQLLRGEHIPTPKNPPVADLFARHGFRETGVEGEVSLFERDLAAGPIPRPEWLKMDVSNEA